MYQDYEQLSETEKLIPAVLLSESTVFIIAHECIIKQLACNDAICCPYMKTLRNKRHGCVKQISMQWNMNVI